MNFETISKKLHHEGELYPSCTLYKGNDAPRNDTFFHFHSAEEASAGVSFTTDLSNIGSGLLAKKSDFGQFSKGGRCRDKLR